MNSNQIKLMKKKGSTTSRIEPGKYETVKSSLVQRYAYRQTSKKRDPFEPSNDGKLWFLFT